MKTYSTLLSLSFLICMLIVSCGDKGISYTKVNIEFQNTSSDTIYFFQKTNIQASSSFNINDTIRIIPNYTKLIIYYDNPSRNDIEFTNFIKNYMDIFYFRKGNKVILDGKTVIVSPNYKVEKSKDDGSTLFTINYKLTLDDQFFQ